jgi:hypothetical protein
MRKNAFYFVLFRSRGFQYRIRIGRSVSRTEVSRTGVILLEIFDVDRGMNLDMGRQIQLIGIGRDLLSDHERTRVFASQVSGASDAGCGRSK